MLIPTHFLTIIGAKQRAKLAKKQLLLETSGGDGEEDEEEEEEIENSENENRKEIEGGGAGTAARVEAGVSSVSDAKSRSDGIPFSKSEILRRKRR